MCLKVLISMSVVNLTSVKDFKKFYFVETSAKHKTYNINLISSVPCMYVVWSVEWKIFKIYKPQYNNIYKYLKTKNKNITL